MREEPLEHTRRDRGRRRRRRRSRQTAKSVPYPDSILPLFDKMSFCTQDISVQISLFFSNFPSMFIRYMPVPISSLSLRSLRKIKVTFCCGTAIPPSSCTYVPGMGICPFQDCFRLSFPPNEKVKSALSFSRRISGRSQSS